MKEIAKKNELMAYLKSEPRTPYRNISHLNATKIVLISSQSMFAANTTGAPIVKTVQYSV